MALLLIGLGAVLAGIMVYAVWRLARPRGPLPVTPGSPHRPPIADEPQILRSNSDGTTYRVNYGRPAGTGWDPYADDQSRTSRVRAARERAGARPPRPTVPDYYALLGLTPDASTFEIERAYRRHAARIHPDRFFDNPRLRLQAEAKLRQLNEAVSTLRDPERRMKYDAEWGLR